MSLLPMLGQYKANGQVQDDQEAAIPIVISSSTMDSALKDQLGLVEPPPLSLSPSVVLNLLPPEQQQDNVPLEYISRMLMEEDEEDRVLLQYDDDHPVLVQAQQSLAHVISSSSSSDSNLLSSPDGTMMRSMTSVTSAICNNTDARNATAARVAEVVEHKWSNVATMSFLTGRVEASKFLPRHSSSAFTNTNKPQVAITRTHGEAEVSRASKSLLAITEPDEEFRLREMMDRMMLNDCEISREEMDDLHATIRNEAAARGKARRRRQLQAVDLHTMLLRCAEAVMTDNHRSALELLEKIKQHSSPTGDATQRLAHCFSEALEARMAGTVSLLHPRSLLIGKKTSSSSAVKFLEAYRLFVATCCFKKVAFAFSNKTIYRAAAARSHLHIVDYGVGFGFQWPSLLRMLASREGGPPEVTITGINLPQPGFRPNSHIEETGHHLSNCARELGVPFKFHAVAVEHWDTIRIGDLGIDPDAVLVVNSLFRFETLVDDSVVVDKVSPRDMVLGNIQRMRPAVFTLGVIHGIYGSSFLTRFREALFFYSAMFDALDATMPRGNQQRLVMESHVLAPFVFNIIACEGQDRTDRFDSYKQWQLRMQRAGLRQLPLDQEIVCVVKDDVNTQYHKDFVIDEDRQWLLQGWKGRILYAHSTWVAHED